MTKPPYPKLLAHALMMLGCFAGCTADDELTIPNRTLDRPMDMVLSCIDINSNGVLFPEDVSHCKGVVATGETKTCDIEYDEGQGDPHLVGFVANSERNEVAMFSACSNRLVDMDTDSPGYSFIPVGSLPSRLVTTADRCQAVTANYGSCDLSVLDIPPLAGYAFDIETDHAPSTYVSRVVPRTGDGRVLASRPGDMIAVPDEYSLGLGETTPPLEEGDTDGVIDYVECTYNNPASVIVTFPNCQLVAEIDLRTQLIVQSRQFVTEEDGTVTVLDTGTTPYCPVDCPDQLEEGSEAATGGVENGEYTPTGVFPNALSMVAADDPNSEVEGDEDPEQIYVLHVGGKGSDTVFAFPYDLDGQWTEEPLRHDLIGARGVVRIRPTPEMQLVEPSNNHTGRYQFLYVIAGDGSTRVIARDLEDLEGTVGTVECDTQYDPNFLSQDGPFCNTAPKISPDATVPDRRAFADGPGIRVPLSGAVVTDWTFQTLPTEDATPTGDENSNNAVTPNNITGVLGIGVTNAGTVTLVNFGHFPERQIAVNGGIVDPLGTMDTTVTTHSVWPSADPTRKQDPTLWPRMQDAPPTRVLAGDLTNAGATKVLAPGLRLIDKAYVGSVSLKGFPAYDPNGGEDGEGDGLNEPGNRDKLGTVASVDEVPTALYENDVVRAIVRDYREWRGSEWVLAWEGPIPGTVSQNGRLVCDEDSLFFHEAYCAPQEEGDSMLVDSRANFCDDGVLAGDKLFVYGCTDDDDCGAGRVCLLDPTGTSVTGLCVSEQRYDSDYAKLLDACAEFIHDPCGNPIREFTITKAFQDRLYLQVRDIPKTSFLDWAEIDDGDPETENVRTPVEITGRLLCAEEQPEGGCVEHADCDGVVELGAEGEEIPFPYCVDGRCRRICDEETEDCALRHLPGPYCYSELVEYQVHTSNSFILSGPGEYSFIDDRVKADDNGECYEDTTMSQLLTSRIRLEETMDANETSLWPIPDCPSDATPGNEDPNPCLVIADRFDEDAPLFHQMTYDGTPVKALRFSNPMMSLVLDLASLDALIEPIPGSDEDSPGQYWPPEFAEFRRSRIPRNYNQRFTTLAGYTPYNFAVQLDSVPLTSPVQVIAAPEGGVVYVVDSSGRGSTQGTRGQVLRVLIQDAQVVPDDTFEVR